MILFLYGPDTWRLCAKLREIVERYQALQGNAFHLSRIDCKQSGSEAQAELRDALFTSPLFGEKKLVVLEHPFLDPTLLPFFQRNIRFLQGEKVFLILKEDGEGEERSPLFVFLQKHARVQRFAPQGILQIRSWVLKELAAHGMTITSDAVSLLLARTQGDRWRLFQDLQKLIAFRCESPASPIAKQDVECFVEAPFEEQAFAIGDALSRGDQKSALQFLFSNLRAGTSPLALFSALQFQCRALLVLKDLKENSSPFGVAVKKSRLHPFVVKKNWNLLERFTREQLVSLFQTFLDKDISLKTSDENPKDAFLSLLWKFSSVREETGKP